MTTNETTTNAETKKKVPILSVATGLMGYATTFITSGEYIVGGLLTISGVACVALYEVYQVRELPAGITDDTIIDVITRVVDEVNGSTDVTMPDDDTTDQTATSFGEQPFGSGQFGGESDGTDDGSSTTETTNTTETETTATDAHQQRLQRIEGESQKNT